MSTKNQKKNHKNKRKAEEKKLKNKNKSLQNKIKHNKLVFAALGVNILNFHTYPYIFQSGDFSSFLKKARVHTQCIGIVLTSAQKNAKTKNKKYGGKSYRAFPVRGLYEIIDKKDKPTFKKISTLDSGFEKIYIFFDDRFHQIHACRLQAKPEKKFSVFKENKICVDRASSDDYYHVVKIWSQYRTIVRICVILKRCYKV